MSRRFIYLFAAGILVLGSTAVVAQETTGSIVGTVVNDVGTPIAGAIVNAVGTSGTVSSVSSSDGRFRFPRVAPGQYTVSTTFEGFQPVETTATVTLGQATTINFSLQQTFSEEIIVHQDTIAIDFTESQTETSIREWEIAYLPRGRDFTDVVAYAAGATDTTQGGGIMIDGASGLENRYIIDGLDTTDPQDGDSSVPMRAEFFEEVQVKSAGYMAEHGGAMGGVINAVTKSGSNDFHGSLFVDYENRSLNGAQRYELEYSLDDATQAELRVYEEDSESRWDPGFSIGGPILRDRWWFFASYNPGIRATDRPVNWQSYPREIYNQDFRVDYTSFNTSANISSAFLLKAGLNLSPYTREGTLPNPDGLADLPDQDEWAPLGREADRETYYLNADWIASDAFVVSARAGFYKTNVMDTGIPINPISQYYSTSSVAGYLDRYPEIPTEWQNGPGWRDFNINYVTQKDQYERTAGGIDGTWYFRGAGDHSLKFGYQIEQISNDVADGWNNDQLLYYWDRAYTTTTAESVQGEYGFFRLRNFQTLGQVETNNQAIFVQDAWSVLPNLTLNIGLRSENEAIPNFGSTGPDPAVEFDWGEKLAPRLGFAWDVKNNAKWKVYGSVGQYYDVTKYEMPRGSFGGDKWVDYYYTFDVANPGLNSGEGCRTGTLTILERPDCPAGSLIEVVDRRLNSADPITWEILGFPQIDPDLKPMKNTEYQIGADHQLTSEIQLGARYVHKEINRTIEDVGLLVPGVGEVYVIANPGEGVVAGDELSPLPYPKPKREYDALELTFDKRFSNNWSMRAYYTLSRLYGNYSGLANSDEQNSIGSPRNPVGTGGRLSPNVSRLYDTASSMYDADGNLVYGRLATDRTHQLGAQFLYSFPIGFNVGVTQYIGSGTPVSTIGTVPIHSFFYPYGRGDQGDTSWLMQTDLSLAYTFTFGRGMAFTVGATILNLFDSNTATRQWGTRQLQDLEVADEDFLTGFDYAEELAALGAAGLDPRYMYDDTFQLPREIRLNLKFEF